MATGGSRASLRARARPPSTGVSSRARVLNLGRPLGDDPRPRIPSQAIPNVVGMRVLTFIHRVLSWLSGRLVVRACASSTGVSSRARVLNPCHRSSDDRYRPSRLRDLIICVTRDRNLNDAVNLCRRAHKQSDCHAPGVQPTIQLRRSNVRPADPRSGLTAGGTFEFCAFDLQSDAPTRRAIDPCRRIPSQAVRIVPTMTFDLLSWIGGGVAVEGGFGY